MEETGPLGQSAVDDFISSVVDSPAGTCHLRYKLWNVENVILFKVLEQNTFPAFELTMPNGSSVYPLDFVSIHWSMGGERILIGLPRNPQCVEKTPTVYCQRVSSTKDAELAIEHMHEMLQNWAKSLSNGFVVAEPVM